MASTKKTAVFLVLGAIFWVMGGCAQKVPLLQETPASLASGQALIDEGKALVSEGDTMIKEGKDLRNKGEDLIDKGDDLRDQGKEKIFLGKQQIKATEMLEEAEALRLKGQQLQQKTAP